MTIALLATIALVAAIGVARVVRRNLADERSSVRDHQQTLDTLRHLSDRRGEPLRPGRGAAGPHGALVPEETPPAAVEQATSGGGRSSAGGRRRVASTPTSGRRARSTVLAARSGPAQVTMRVEAPPRSALPETDVSSPEVPVRHAAMADVPVPDTSGGPVDLQSPRTSHTTTAADAVHHLAATRALYGSGPKRLTMPNPRRRDHRPLVVTVAAVVVVGTLTAVAVALRPAPHPTASGPPAAQDHATTPPATKKRAPTTKTPSPKKPEPPTGLVPVTASTTEATYDVPGAPYSVTMSATGPCWVEAVDVTTGQVLWEGTLEAGQSQTVPATSGLFLRLGNTPDVTVTEGGQTVQLPTGYATVFNLTFVTA